MRIITYQRKIVVDKLLKDGEYKITDPKQMRTLNAIKKYPWCKNWEKAYDYMFDRMKKKIKNKRDFDDDIIAPIWGWYKVENFKKINHDNKGLYRITLNIKNSKVLLSDFGLYECFAISSIGCIYYGDRGGQIAKELYQREKEEGRECIYKVYDKMINKNHLKHAEYIQATFFKIKMKDVISIEKVTKKDYRGYSQL